MCLAIPGRLLNVTEAPDSRFRTGQVSFDGVVRSINLSLLPEAMPGDYVLVHVGAAIARVDEEEARQNLEYLRQMGEVDEWKGEANNEA